MKASLALPPLGVPPLATRASATSGKLGLGLLIRARVFQVLALRQPDLDNGVYAYARALSGDFPEGSMDPKVEAASRFAQATGRRAPIGSLEHIEAMLEGEAGTQVRLDSQAP